MKDEVQSVNIARRIGILFSSILMALDAVITTILLLIIMVRADSISYIEDPMFLLIVIVGYGTTLIFAAISVALAQK